MQIDFYSADHIKSAMNWESAVSAVRSGHSGARPVLQDLLLENGPFSLFGRGVILPGKGAGMKIASIFPPNATAVPPHPAEDALFLVVDETTKRFTAILDGPEITRLKTAADSALGSQLLSSSSSKVLLVLGGGPIAAALVEAHLAVRPSIEQVLLWNRTPDKLTVLAAHLRSSGRDVRIVSDLEDATAEADIISSATSARQPLIQGRRLKPRCHVDLVGSYRPDMREADDEVMRRARVYVDIKGPGVDQSGDLLRPIETGALSPDGVAGDLFDLVADLRERADQGLTVFKNGGGAHLDLMVALSVIEQGRMQPA